MLTITANNGVRHCDGFNRRDWLHCGVLSLAGLSLPALLKLEASAKATTQPTANGLKKAKSVIILFLSGGSSQLDTWDLKPLAPLEIRGSFQPIRTGVPGLQICEHMPRMSRLANHYAVVRSVQHATTNHPAASYWMMVGSPMLRVAPQAVTLSREDRPHPGSALAKVLGPSHGMPAFALIPEAISPVGPERPGQHAGFLGAAYDPYRINSDPNLPSFSPGALTPLRDVPPLRLAERRNLLGLLTEQSRELEGTNLTKTLDSYYTRAFDLVSSVAVRRAFDIEKESTSTRERYGRHVFGQSVLLARRLVEAGVRLVQVNWVRHDRGKGGQGFDSHRNHLDWCKKELLPPTDAAFSSLIEDLSDRGLIQETLVIMMGEFGRTPRFNKAGGRDHWSNCFSVVMAGGGIRGGQVLGASDRIAAFPTTDPISPQDIMATLFARLGVDPHQLIYDQQRRPYVLAEGRPLQELT